MDMGTNKPVPTPLVDEDLESMTRDELIAAVLRWRNIAPQIKDICQQLSDYREIAPTPADLKVHIDDTMKMYRDTIAQQTAQIEEMQTFIDQLVDDPLQIEDRLNQHTGRPSKKNRLN